MVGHIPLEDVILVRVQVSQQSSLVSKDLEGSKAKQILSNYRIPAESSIQNKKLSEWVVFC